jgi:hypothetical protein
MGAARAATTAATFKRKGRSRRRRRRRRRDKSYDTGPFLAEQQQETATAAAAAAATTTRNEWKTRGIGTCTAACTWISSAALELKEIEEEGESFGFLYSTVKQCKKNDGTWMPFSDTI